MTTILGIDDSGRGSVIGPMVISGALFKEKDIEKLKKLGVKDSKLLSPGQRERLSKKIKKLVKDYIALKVSAKNIDNLRKIKNLNIIEAETMAQILKVMKADVAYIDAPQVSTEKFKALLIKLSSTKTNLIVENYAERYPSCAAASIIAKVERDKEIEKIKKETGFDCGVGYPHDSRAIAFVKKFMKHEIFSKYIRHSWITTQELKKKQKNLKEFINK